MLNNIRIGNKLLMILCINIILLAILGIVAAMSAKSINNNLKSLYSRDLRGIMFLLEADRDLHQAFIAERTMIFAPVGGEIFNSQLKDYTENKGQADTRVGKFNELASNDSQHNLVGAVRGRTHQVGRDLDEDRQGQGRGPGPAGACGHGPWVKAQSASTPCARTSTCSPNNSKSRPKRRPPGPPNPIRAC